MVKKCFFHSTSKTRIPILYASVKLLILLSSFQPFIKNFFIADRKYSKTSKNCAILSHTKSKPSPVTYSKNLYINIRKNQNHSINIVGI